MRSIGRILVGLEFSEAGRAALSEASLLARTFGAKLMLLHGLPDLGAHVESEAHRLLSRAVEDLERQGILGAAPLLTRELRADEALLQVAGEHEPDLIVLGAGSKTLVERLLLGATAERVVRESPRPVWLVRPSHVHSEVKRIVCAVDDSDPAREALALAAFLARTFVASLRTLSVIPPGTSRSGALEQVLSRIDLHGIDHGPVLRQGSVVKEVVEATTELGADLLVLGSARRSGLERILDRNTAEEVLRLAPCSTLTVPSPPRS